MVCLQGKVNYIDKVPYLGLLFGVILSLLVLYPVNAVGNDLGVQIFCRL